MGAARARRARILLAKSQNWMDTCGLDDANVETAHLPKVVQDLWADDIGFDPVNRTLIPHRHSAKQQAMSVMRFF